MIASLKICAAVHGTVDDNMAVHGTGDESGGEQNGERGDSHDIPTLFRTLLTFPLDHIQFHKHAEVARRNNYNTVSSLLHRTAFTGAGFSPYEVPQEMGIFHEITRQVEIADR